MATSGVIQIKRSNTSVTPANTLFDGELAFSYPSNTLFIGSQQAQGAVAEKIAGTKYSYLDNVPSPGVVAPNAAITTDANGYFTNAFTGALTISTSAHNPTAPQIVSISNAYSAVNLGSTSTGLGTELVTSYAIKQYIDGKAPTAASGGSNTQIQFNDSGVISGSNGFVFNKTTNTVSIANTLYVGGGALTITPSAVGITANASVSVNIAANTLSLSTPLPFSSGGLGINTINNQDLLVGNTTNGISKLSLGSNGQILQSNGTALVYAAIDCGTF